MSKTKIVYKKCWVKKISRNVHPQHDHHVITKSKVVKYEK